MLQPPQLHLHVLLRLLLYAFLLVERELLGNIVEEELLPLLVLLVPLRELMLAEVRGMEGDFPEFVVNSGFFFEVDGV